MADYAARIEDARFNADELGRIADELAFSGDPKDALLRTRAIALKLKLGLAARAAGPALTGAADRPSWLDDLSLPPIDGRPLHAYGLSDHAFIVLEAKLKRRNGLLPTHDRVFAAQFVLWAAEWFRRCYDGTGQRWDTLGAALGIRAAWGEYRKLTDVGLREWRIPELRINGTHHRLAALARQGGFPMAALEGNGAGWAPRFLERLVGRLLAEPEPSLDAAERTAFSLNEDVPETWRSQEIRIVSAELAVCVVRLRQRAEAGGASGQLASSWLDLHYPNWRDELPLGLTRETGRVLLDGLLATVLAGGGGAVRVRRLLAISTGGRREQVELKLAGTLTDVSGRAILRTLGDDWSRLRLHPSGEFARYVAGELATAEPREDGCWMARPTTSRSVFDLPAAVSVATELRGGVARVGSPFRLPGGEPLTTGLRAYVAEGEPADGNSLLLAGVGTGSGGYPPEQLYLDAPDDWGCEPHGNGATCALIESGSGAGRRLWCVEGAVIATSQVGDRYLVRTGQKGDQRDRLVLLGDAPPGIDRANDDVPVFLGVPRIQLREGRRERGAAPGEIHWRIRGATSWRSDLDRAVPGRCEFAWRDTTTGHIRDRQEAVVLPAAFQIERIRSADRFDLTVSGWPDHIEVEGGLRVDSRRWRFGIRGSPRSCAQIRLQPPEGELVTLRVGLPHQAWIDNWTAGPLARNERISISNINRYVARADGRCELLADLFDRNGRPVPEGSTSWWVEGELPLSTIRDDLAALLRPLADLRAVVKLNFNDGHNDHWFVGEFDHELRREGRGWRPDRVVNDEEVRVVGRTLARPVCERDFGEYGLLASANHRPLELPTLHGDWLVYLRSNARVLSCPLLVRGLAPTTAPTTPLAKAMAIGERTPRLAAICALIDKTLATPTSPESRTLIREAIDLALSLDGLPPGTFDILALMAERPLLGAVMLFQVAAPQLEVLFRLTEGLPTAWATIPARCWDQAGSALAEQLFAIAPDDPGLVGKIVSDRRKAIAEHEPALAPLLGLRPPRVPLMEAANAFLNRSGDQVRDMRSPCRPARDRLLPDWKVGSHFWRVLDAPVVAALAAREVVRLESPEVRCIKDVARRHPRWFRQGFAAALKDD